ncbi:MAG: hypothetical protein AB7Q69_04125 [Gemmatimonadales bacterium]
MTHLSMEQLLQLRGPVLDAGSADASRHLESCPACQAEFERLHQRVARLKALPSLRPPRDAWPAIQARVRADRHRRRVRWTGVGGLALAASVALLLLVNGVVNSTGTPSPALQEIDAARAESQRLEGTIRALNPEARVLDGRTARVAADLEDRIAALDHQLETAQLMNRAQRNDQLLRLWRERVGLLDALVDVHVTRASNVGM